MKVLMHVGLTVSDMERAVRFYTGLFDFRFDRELRMSASQLQPLMGLAPPSDIHAVYLMLGPFTLELMQYAPASAQTAAARQFNQTGLAHLSLAVEDIDAILARVPELGGTVLSHVGRAALLRDPEGQLIELVLTAVNDEVEAGRAARRGENA